MLVIETNVSYDSYGKFCDHQSRIIEINSWEDYVQSYIDGKAKKFQGTMQGFNFHEKYNMSSLKYDNFHLSCDFSNGTQKLAYRLDEVFELGINIDKIE